MTGILVAWHPTLHDLGQLVPLWLLGVGIVMGTFGLAYLAWWVRGK